MKPDMNDSILVAIIAATPGLGAAWLAYRQAVKSAKITTANDTLRIEAEAYERARRIYEAGIAQLESQVKALKAQISEEQDISGKLRLRVSELEETVAQLRFQLMRAGIELTK